MIQQMSLDNENQMKFNHYRAEKNHQQLREIYSRWKSITDQRRRERFLLHRAEVFFERSLMRRAFQQWKEQHQFDLRVHVSDTRFHGWRLEDGFQLLERQAIWFDRMRLIGRVFVQWKQNWQIEQRLNEQKQRALMFWALQLQKRVNILQERPTCVLIISVAVFCHLADLHQRTKTKEGSVQRSDASSAR